MIRENLDIYADNLFADLPVMQDRGLQRPMIERILRVRDIFSYWREWPSKTPQEIMQWDMQAHPGLKRLSAWDDLTICKDMMGRMNQDSRDWHQWFFNQQILALYKKALAAEDYKSAEKAMADYAKFNKLDKDEPQKAPQIEPERIVFRDDPTLIGLKRMEDRDSVIEKFEKKYMSDIEEASYEEVLVEAKKQEAHPNPPEGRDF